MAQFQAVSPPDNRSPSSTTPSIPASTAGVAGSTAASALLAAQAAAAAAHKRVYQACIPCRRRKVRCDLGSVDNPHDPPCVRCRRESKECFFSATRRKRKNEDGREGSEDPETDEYVIRNGRKRLRASGSPTVTIDRRMFSEVPLTPGGSQGRREPLRRPDGMRGPGGNDHVGGRRVEFGVGEEPSATLNNPEAQNALRQGVYGPHDALDLLYKAATDNHKRDVGLSGDSLPKQNHLHPGAGGVPKSATLSRVANGQPSGVKMEQPIDPELSRSDPSAVPGYTEALKAWSRFRFVRAGWFTAQEAIGYIEYYYANLSPLTPISPPTFRNPASHQTLLTEEPILTITLLTIASRYRRMPGTGGHCRSHAIHEQLWTYLRGMIERCLWGQEAFGGGLCAQTEGAQTSSTAPWRGLRKGSLRTLGTIESLMILTEWHPRALHFPPAEAIDELMLPLYDSPADFSVTDEDGNQRAPAGVGGRRIESWLEPAWRSDRMCWMLLSTAMGLAFELGVFDDIDELFRDGAIDRPEYEEETYRQRAYRIKRLLMIYLTQLAGRLGWTNMVPESLRKSDPAVSRRRPTSVEGTTPATNPSSMSNAFNYIPDLELDDQIIHCWAGISNAMHIGNEKLFKSRKHTTEIIQNGKYTDLLRDFQPMLRDWWKEFERFRLPPYIRYILTIEYEYVRIYINSLSLQAVVERCTNTAAGGSSNTGRDGGSTTGSNAQLSPQTQNYYGKLPLGQVGGLTAADHEYVREVVDGSRNLLRTVVEGLLPGDFLKHAPVRTYFRIISGAMFLLKTFALGAPRADVKLSIELMDSTVEALRNCVVDDVHLGIRFADLLESLTSRLRNRFIQAPPLVQQGAAADGKSPNPHAENGGLNGHGADGAQANGVDGLSGQNWSNHAAKFRDGLNGPDRPGTPSAANNISATPYDGNLGNFYPSGAASVLGPSTPAPMDGTMGDDVYPWADGNPGDGLWYLAPGPTFFQNIDGGSGVAMAAEPGAVGGIDLLDYLAMDQSFPLMDGGSYQ